MARGNQGRAIYADGSDRKMRLETVGEACERTGWRIHAYVMMGNHYHLLVQTPEANLVAGMKRLQGTYTRRWLAENLRMGYETRLSQAVREIESSQEPAVMEMKMKKRLAESVL